MTSHRFNSSRTDHWTSPRPHRDESLRLHAHGRIYPMEHEKKSNLTLYIMIAGIIVGVVLRSVF